VSLTVNQAPAITGPDIAAFTVGQAGSFTITTTGYPTPAITETGSLPAGVTLTDNGDGTATLAGVPQEGTAGTYSLTLIAANAISSATQSFTLTVNPQYQIVIGDPSTPLKVKPSIYLDSIINSLFSVNGVVENFNVVSITQSPIAPNYLAQSQGGTVKVWTGVPQSGPIPAGY